MNEKDILKLLKNKKIQIAILISIIIIGFIYYIKNSNYYIKGYEVKFNLSNTKEEIKEKFSDYEISHSGDDYVIFEDVKFDYELIGNLRFDFNEDNSIKEVKHNFSKSKPSHIVNLISNLNGESVHSENYNDKRNHQASFVWSNKNAIIVANFYPLYRDENILCSIEYLKNDEEFRQRQKDYENNQLEIQNNIEKDSKLKDYYNIITSNILLKSHPITEAIEDGAKFKEKSLNDLYFSKNIKLFDTDAEVIYSVIDPKNDSLNRAKYHGEIEEVYFNIYTTNIEDILPKISLIFGENYEKRDSNYVWSNSRYN